MTTNNKRRPNLSIPPPITSSTLNTWAFDTMSRRINNEILERTYIDNKQTWSQPEWKHVMERFNNLRLELQNAATTKIRYLSDNNNDNSVDETIQQEINEWNDILRPHIHQTYLTAPWLVTEFYVYRRLMECLDYFDTTSVGYLYDPFAPQKQAGLHSSINSAETILALSLSTELAISISLWGNKMDLSLWPVVANNAKKEDAFLAEQSKESLLHDDLPELKWYCEKLQNQGGGQVDIVVDNAGFELVTDLILAQYLIESKIAETVTFQLKSHPTFVSDATVQDFMATIDYYESLNVEKYPNCHQAGKKWRTYIDQGQWKYNSDRFWAQGAPMWDMRNNLYNNLQQHCDFMFVKGDANYRRLVGDCQWEYTSSFDNVVGAYFPCPICALRCLKSELGINMDKMQIERAKSLDQDWMTNGRFGVIQFSVGTLQQ